MRHPDYAPDRVSAIRSYYVLEHDLTRLFDYIEPADSNLQTFSHRIYELLLRASTEFEAHCKAILLANGYQNNNKHLNIEDYRKVNSASRLSEYQVGVLAWHSPGKVIQPFADWGKNRRLSWYTAYNQVKHNRHSQFNQANLAHALDAIAAVSVLLFSQFYVYAFRARDEIGMSHLSDGWLSHEDSIFALKPPAEWSEGEYYNFDWDELVRSHNMFAAYRF